MSKSGIKLTGRLAGFDPAAFANEFVTVDEVLEIKRAFDLCDYDGGGSIDPKGIFSLTQNWKKPSTHSVSKLKPKLFGTWLLKSTKMVADSSNLMNSSVWWQPDLPKTNPGKKFIKFSLPSTLEEPDSLPWKIWEKSPRDSENFKMTTSSNRWSKGLISIKTVWSLKRSSIILWPRRPCDHTSNYISNLIHIPNLIRLPKQ